MSFFVCWSVRYFGFDKTPQFSIEEFSSVGDAIKKVEEIKTLCEELGRQIKSVEIRMIYGKEVKLEEVKT